MHIPDEPRSNYRPGVGAILQDSQGLILIGERQDYPGIWQFPQGGRASEEEAEEALARELNEELSLDPGDYQILQKRGPYRYLFPPGRTKENYSGQEHFYFLLRMLAPAGKVRFETSEQEFRAVRWIKPEAFALEWPGEMKRAVYARLFRDFFHLELR